MPHRTTGGKQIHSTTSEDKCGRWPVERNSTADTVTSVDPDSCIHPDRVQSGVCVCVDGSNAAWRAWQHTEQAAWVL